MAGGRYFWLKLKRDFFKRHDITILESFPDGKEILLFYIKLLCESADHDGRLRFSDEIPYTWSMLSAVTRTDQKIVNAAMEILQELGLVEILDDSTIYMKKIGDMVGSESAEAGKKRDQRRRKGDGEGTTEGQAEDTEGTVEGQNEDNEGQCPDNVPTMSDRDKSIEFRDQNNIEKENKEKKPAEPTVASTIAESGLADEVQAALREFSKMRTKIKAGMTANAMRLTINSLKKLSTDPKEQEAIVNQSIEKSWKGLFPLKDAPKQQEPPKRPTGKFYDFEQHPHTEEGDAALEAKAAMASRERFKNKWND